MQNSKLEPNSIIEKQPPEKQLQVVESLRRFDHLVFRAEDNQEIASLASSWILEQFDEIQTTSLYLYDANTGEHVFLRAVGRGKNTESLTDSYSGISADAALQVEVPWQIFTSEETSFSGSTSNMIARLPIILDNSYLGYLEITAGEINVFDAEMLFHLKQAVDSLAIALNNARQRKIETERRREAELMRDILGALASSADLNQTLEIILVNLRSLVEYDTARLFLLDRTLNATLIEKVHPGDRPGRSTFPASEPMMQELEDKRKPVIVGNILDDGRFHDWPDMQTVKGWMGVPIFAGEEMIGFISLSSLQADHFQQADADVLQVFANQIGRILERAWLHEQTHRQTEELEVLSKITSALGQIDSEESIFPAIIQQITDFYGAIGGTFLFPEKYETGLFVRFSQTPGLTGMTVPPGEDVFWEVLQTGKSRVLTNIPAYLRKHPEEQYIRLLEGCNFAVVTPLKTQSEVMGILLLLFDRESPYISNNLGLLDTITSVFGLFLQRAILLDATEKRLQVRTRHLNALYNISQVAGETLELSNMLEKLLEITLELMGSDSGLIALVDEDQDENPILKLVTEQHLPVELSKYLQEVLIGGFWEELLYETKPLVVPNISEEPRLPASARKIGSSKLNACILAPARVGNRPLGMIGIFNESILEYSIEDITLFMNITDQIGSAIERARLAGQARQAAVIRERQRLARELHDSVTQLLYSQVLFAGAGLRVLDQNKLELTHQHLERIDQGAQQALKEMRLLVYELRPAVYLQEGLIVALQHRLEAVEKRGGINAELNVNGEINIDEALEVALYRIAEEALNNILKHSSANNVTINLYERNNQLLLEIIDDGSGFNLEQVINQGGMGLHNIQERAQALGGTATISSTPHSGTRIIVELGLKSD